MVQSAPVLVKHVARDGPKADQRAAEVVDDAAVQEAERFTGRGVGVLGQLDQHRPAEHAVVEMSRPFEVGDGESDMRDGGGA